MPAIEPNIDQHPYTALTPDLVQDALASAGLWGDGRLQALNSFENRVYQAHLEMPVEGTAVSQVIAKFYRPHRWSDAQIEEEHRFTRALADDEVPVVAPLVLKGRTLHHLGGFAWAVWPRRGGRRPELDDLDVLEWIGRLLARLHNVGAAASFVHRPSLDVHTFGHEPRDWLLRHGAIAPEVVREWTRLSATALQRVAQYPALQVAASGARAAPDGTRLLRLHGDCHPGNILWTPIGSVDAGPHFVDLDDSRTGPAVQDLWMLLSGERHQQTRQLAALLDGYEQIRDFDRQELALIEPLRTLRLIHYSAWIARRWTDPAFQTNFPWFGSRDYWQGEMDMLVGQIEAMDKRPLVV